MRATSSGAAKRKAKRLHDRILSDGRAESERLIRTAEGELARGRFAARERLRADLLAQAVAIARRAALEVDATTDRRLVSETVDTVDREGRN